MSTHTYHFLNNSKDSFIRTFIFAAITLTLFCQPSFAVDNVFLFSYFQETNGANGLHLAYSLDGLSYHALNGNAGFVQDTQSTPFMRDPSICYGGDGLFHMTYTTSWGATNFGYMDSPDLLSWNHKKQVNIMGSIPTTGQVWAPESYWDANKGQYIVYWSSEVTSVASGLRIYASTTTDFNTFSTPSVFFDPGMTTIDATIVKDGSNFRLVAKSEGNGKKNIYVTPTTTSPYGPYPIAPLQDVTTISPYASEGPSVTKLGDNWLVYNDHYGSGVYGAMISTDNMATWNEYTGGVAFPSGTRHGNVLTVPYSVAQNLAVNAANKPSEDEFVGSAGTSDYHTAANWFAGSVPSAGQTPIIQAGQTVNMSSSPSITLPGLKVGQTSIGTLNINNNTVVTSSAVISLGERLTGNGTIVQNGTSSVTVNSYISIGTRGTGTYRLQNGSLTVNGDFNVGDYQGANGTLYQEGGTISATSFFVASAPTGGFTSGNTVGNVYQSGGTLNITGSGDKLLIGGRDTSSAIANYELTGGTINAGNSRVTVGNQGIGSLTVSGTGQANLTSGLRITGNATGNGSVHLDGGTITATNVQSGGGTSTFHFNGGTLKASGSSTSFITGMTTLDVENGGAVIDSNGFNITVAQPISSASAAGGLTKNGAGVLTLTGANYYSGPTTIAQGTLKLETTTTPTIVHRWGFNGSLNDSVGSSNASIIEVGGNNATLSSTQVTLTGGSKSSSDYVKLGANLLPKTNVPVTIELWATPINIQKWSRIFDFGTSTTENLFMSWTKDVAAASDRVEWKDTDSKTLDNTNQPYNLNTEYHIVMELNPANDTSTTVTWYTSAAGNTVLGAAKGSFTVNNTLANFADAEDNLGRSFYNDNTANASYNEVRFWDGALSSHALEVLHSAGPDAIIDSLDFGTQSSLPSTTDVSLTGTGTTLDLNNLNQTIESLSGVAGSSVLLGTGSLTVNGGKTSTFGGTITGQGELIISGSSTSLSAKSIKVHKLTIGSSAPLVSATASASTTAVPEPAAWLMLLLAATSGYFYGKKQNR